MSSCSPACNEGDYEAANDHVCGSCSRPSRFLLLGTPVLVMQGVIEEESKTRKRELHTQRPENKTNTKCQDRRHVCVFSVLLPLALLCVNDLIIRSFVLTPFSTHHLPGMHCMPLSLPDSHAMNQSQSPLSLSVLKMGVDHEFGVSLRCVSGTPSPRESRVRGRCTLPLFPSPGPHAVCLSSCEREQLLLLMVVPVRD